MSMNRLYNAGNPWQGEAKRVLCVCSAGLLRSPTAAVVLAQEPFNYNTRAAGCEADFALIPVDKVLLTWAQEIVTMTWEQKAVVQEMLREFMIEDKEVICLGVPDNFGYRDPELMEMIQVKYMEQSNEWTEIEE